MSAVDSGSSRALRDASPKPRYNTAAVVRLVGVPAATFRAWERRYGFPNPARQAAGQRRYSEQDVLAIRWLHEQTRRGLSVSRAVGLIRRILSGPEQPLEPLTEARATDELAAELLAALLATDRAQAEAVLAEAFSQYAFETVALEVVEPLLATVGEWWQAGRLGVADEHYATQFVLHRLFSLLKAYDRPRGHGLVVTACGPGEWHEVGIVIVSLFLLRRGYRVLYLGPNLPLDQLGDHLARLGPDLVCLSATRPETARALIRDARRLVYADGQGPLIAVGGQGFRADPGQAGRRGVSYLGRTAPEAVRAVEWLLPPNRGGPKAPDTGPIH